MKRLVLSGSVKLQAAANKWLEYFSNKYEILDYPRPLEKTDFEKEYPRVYKDYFENLIKTDILFIMNEDKKGIEGYIGAETFAELAFVVANNQMNKTNIKIWLLKMPSKEVQSYSEIMLWLKLGWINLFSNEYES